MGSKHAILVVDDTRENTFSIHNILKKLPCAVVQTADSHQVAAALSQYNFSLAVLNIKRPAETGYKIAEFLRSREKTKVLPLIIIVSETRLDDTIWFTGYENGPVDILPRLFSPGLLLGKAKLFLQLDEQHTQQELYQTYLNNNENFFQSKLRERTAQLEETITALRSEIKKRKDTEKALIKAKKEWEEIFEATGHMTMIVDREFTITSVNRAAQNHIGIYGEEILGSRCYEIFHQSDQPIRLCPVTKLLGKNDHQAKVSEVEINGKTYIISCTPVYDEAGNLDKIIHTSTDISKQKQLKRELIQAHKMEAIGSLAGGIAHDFNNILSSVLGYTELSLESVEKGSEIEQDLHQVYAAGIRAKDLVKQILNFARKSDEGPKPVRLDIIGKEAVKFLRSTLPATIEIKQDITSTSYILANPIKIHQLLMNLCTNAAHAMHETGTLRISIKDVILEEMDLPKKPKLLAGKYQQLKISDTGSGIHPDIIGKIFHPYFTTKGIHEGTGIGLSIALNIVKEYGGSISVVSNPGQGALFTVLLPIASIQEKEGLIEEQNLLPPGREKILVVDDEPAICKLLERMLTGNGYKVTSETSSENAYALFAAHPETFDLVLTDLAMPKLPGDILTRRIRSIRKDIPVIMATGYNKRISNQQAEELGVMDLIIKPYEKAVLLETVFKALER